LKPTSDFERRLQAQTLLARRVEGDRLMLPDSVLLAALDGSRALTPNERSALAQSPLTLRRFRQLAMDHRTTHKAANDASWSGSRGMLRAAAGSAALDVLSTDDGCWTLHFLQQGELWQVILALAADAPYAARLLREGPPLRVRDGTGAAILRGRLDADGECEAKWPFALAPAAHFQQHGATFVVEPDID
jgi:hypothetical protein